MQLWLTPLSQSDTRIRPPTACPYAGCAGRRFRLLHRVAKPIRDATPRTLAVDRYLCRACGRSFRVYPPGVDRGDVAVGVKRLAAALHLAGLSFRDVSRALAVFGAPLGKSQVQAVVAPKLKGLKHRSVAPLLGRVVLTARAGDGGCGGTDGDAAEHDGHADGGAAGNDARPVPGRRQGERDVATVTIHGRALPLRRAVDHRGRVALVVDGVDRRTWLAVMQWAQATLAGLGVAVDVVFPVTRGRYQSGATSDATSAAARMTATSAGRLAASAAAQTRAKVEVSVPIESWRWRPARLATPTQSPRAHVQIDGAGALSQLDVCPSRIDATSGRDHDVQCPIVHVVRASVLAPVHRGVRLDRPRWHGCPNHRDGRA